MEHDFLAAKVRTHQGHLGSLARKLISDISKRAENHDASRMCEPEFEEAARLAKTAAQFGIDSEEYREARANSQSIRKHWQVNTHHPEHFSDLGQMGWLDIIEMVLDWSAAVDTYGLSTFAESVERNLRAYPFSEGQTWLIRQVAEWVSHTEEDNSR
ncbi:MAG: DUF5662 family protein [Parcubacteria group bacterium]|jgi:hypothetical protein